MNRTKLLNILKTFLVTGGLLCGTMIAATNSMPASILPPSASNKARQEVIANLLHWHEEPGANLCNGYYAEPEHVKTTPPTKDFHKKTLITSHGPNFFRLNGISVLNGNVIVTQPDREAHADRAYITRNKAGQIEKIRLVGHVHLYEHDKHFVTDHLVIKTKSQYLLANTVVYQVAMHYRKVVNNYVSDTDKQCNDPTSSPEQCTDSSQDEEDETEIPPDEPDDPAASAYTHAWGTAKQVEQIKPGIKQFINASYSTCPPRSPAWQLRAKKLILNKNTGIGKLYNGQLRLKGVPVFPLPYWRFPLGRKRTSGFLMPSFMTGHLPAEIDTSNYIYDFPIYLYLAPNYDDLFTPKIYTARGIQLVNNFRYMNKYLTQDLSMSWVPHDKLANEERQIGIDSIRNNPSFPANAATGYIDGLEKLKPSRYAIFWSADSTLDSDLSAHLTLNRTSDSYFFRDYSFMLGSNNNLLRSYLNVDYTGNHWQSHILYESYQTLHRYDQLDYTVISPYERQPEITLDGYYPGIFNSNLTFSITNSMDRFELHDPFRQDMPTGLRLHSRPTLEWPITMRGGEITPGISYDLTAYNLDQQGDIQNKSSTRALPILHVSSSWTFVRNMRFWQHPFRNEINPQLFYLYVPYKNQNQYPNFDSYLLPFTYSQLFAMNRFAGFDRLSNANQLSIALTDRLIDAATGATRASFRLGIADAFTPSRVCLNENCSTSSDHLSPLVTDFSYGLATHWSFSSSAAWDLNNHAINHLSAGFSYSGDQQKIFNLNYSYAPINEGQLSTEALNQQGFWLNDGSGHTINASATWPITSRWRLLGYTDYNFQDKHSNLSFFGVQYSSCCWRFRFVLKRQWLSRTLTNSGGYNDQFSNGMLFSIQLTGLADFGQPNQIKAMTNHISGFG